MYTTFLRHLPLRAGLLAALVLVFTSAISSTAAAQNQRGQPLLLASQSSIHRLGPDQPEGSAEFVVDASNQLIFHLHTSDAGLITSISGPGGEVINPQTITSFDGEFVKYAGDKSVDEEAKLFLSAPGHHQIYSLPSLGPGVYTLHFAASTSTADEVVLARLIADSPLAAALLISENTLVLGDVAVMTTAVFEGVNAVTGAEVLATIYPADEGETPITFTLRDNGANADNAARDGLYSAEFEPPEAGLYTVVAEISGQTSSGLAYRRTASALFEVVAAVTAPAATVSDRVEDDNGNGLYERMLIDVALNVQQAGAYRVFVQLEASNGQKLAASARANLATGAQTVPVPFDAVDLREIGVDGPFTITAVEWLVYGSQQTQPAGRRFDLGTTQAYNLGQWERPPIRLTGNSSDQAADTNSNTLFDQLTVQLGVEVMAGGEYHWTAQLEDSSGRAIGLAAGATTLMTGTNSIDLNFAGQGIGQNGRDGPYTVTRLALFGDEHAFLGDGVAVTQAYSYLQFEGAAAATTVPELIGLEQVVAENALAAADLTVGVTDTLYSATIAPGSVLSQTPAAGVATAEGYAVDLIFSLGPRPVKVPDVRTLTQENAEILLATFGMTLGAINEQSSIEPQGQVLAQNPLPGVTQPEGSSVALFVSRGDRIQVPNFQGLKEEDARALIQDIALTVGVIATGFHDTIPAGQVFDQFPFAGAAAQPGTAIGLTISRGRGVSVPDLLRLSEANARTALANGELRTGMVSHFPHATIPAGAVALQDPPAGTTVAVSSTVDLLLSAGPVVLATTPQVNSTAPANTPVIFAYDKAVDPASVNRDTFSVHALQTGLLTGTFAVQGQKVHLTPNRRMKAGEVVYVSATRAVQFQDGDQPSWPAVWQFQVAPPTASDAVFTQAGDFFFRSRGAALGDLDGDEDLDVFFSRGDDAVILFNRGNGVLVMGDQILRLTTNTAGNLQSHHTFVALGDLDHDGDLDAFVTIGESFALKNGRPDQIWFNDGTGRFTDSGQRLAQGDNAETSVGLGDVDGDGDLDAVISDMSQSATNATDRRVTIWQNLGTGIFTRTQELNVANGQEWVLGDVDGDGDLDAIGDAALGPNFVWLNSGLGKFFDSGQRFGDGVKTALGDVDSDGDLDAVVAGGLINVPGSKVFLNQGGSQSGEPGVFAESQVLEGLLHSQVDLVDVDGDSDLDAIFQHDNEPNEIWRNDGNGVFTRRGQIAIGQFILEAYFGDIDGDGTVDAFVAYIDTSDNEPDDKATVLLNKIPAAPASQRLNLPAIRRLR